MGDVFMRKFYTVFDCESLALKLALNVPHAASCIPFCTVEVLILCC